MSRAGDWHTIRQDHILTGERMQWFELWMLRSFSGSSTLIGEKTVSIPEVIEMLGPTRSRNVLRHLLRAHYGFPQFAVLPAGVCLRQRA